MSHVKEHSTNSVVEIFPLSRLKLFCKFHTLFFFPLFFFFLLLLFSFFFQQFAGLCQDVSGGRINPNSKLEVIPEEDMYCYLEKKVMKQ